MNSEIVNPGLYLYGFVSNQYDAEQFQKLENIGVFSIPYQKISAVVSKSAILDYKQLSTGPLAKLLIEHQKRIESVINIGFDTIIPMRFGTFANNTSEVLKILAKGYDLIVEILVKVSNLIEIDVAATWSDFGSIISEIAVDPRVMEMKANIMKNSANVTQFDQMAIGSLVKKILDEKTAGTAARIAGALGSVCQQRKQYEVMNDEMVFNSAFLLNQSQQELFEKALDRLDEEMNGQVNFKMVGPLPCYSFYTMEVNELCFGEVYSAQKELGLEISTSEKGIKQAYLEKAKMFHPDVNQGFDNQEDFDRINKAYQVMLDYVKAVKPVSREEQFSLSGEAVNKNSFYLKIRE
jgi:hypothetical protein